MGGGDMTQLLIDGETFDVPAEDDWELGELAELSRLKDKWGDMGATIGLVWIAKHRQDPSFTVEQAGKIKVGQVDEVPGDKPVPLGGSDGSSETSSSSRGPSENHVDSGLQLSPGTTG